MSQMTPREIVQELDKHIVGQDEAKRAVAIALRNRWRRVQVDELTNTVLVYRCTSPEGVVRVALNIGENDHPAAWSDPPGGRDAVRVEAASGPVTSDPVDLVPAHGWCILSAGE